jgi:uncharacterized protein YfdQ (DUF2303 family)
MSSTIDNEKTINRLLEVGKSIGTQIHGLNGGDPFVIVPQGWAAMNMSAFAPPNRITIRMNLTEAESFIAYVNRFKTDDTIILANIRDDGGSFIARMDYHSKAPELKPSYNGHIAALDCIRTNEFNTWMKANGVRMMQMELATWLEENQSLLVEPSGAELMEIVTSLHGHSEARFNQTVRLKDGGCKLQYDEDVMIRGGAPSSKSGELELPDFITAGIAPFEGSPTYKIKARLKVRIENRKLWLWYETINPHRIVRDSLSIITKLIEEKTGIKPFIGHF